MNIVAHIWREQPGAFFALASISATGQVRHEWFTPDEFDQLDEVIAELEEAAPKGVYFCPHGFTQTTRRKVFAVPGNWLFADLDTVDPRKLGVLRPTIGVETSAGSYQAYWRALGLFEQDLNRRMTYATGADKGGWALTKLLRVPGTVNRKPERDAETVRLLWADGRRYLLPTLRRLLPDDGAGIVRAAGRDADALVARLLRQHARPVMVRVCARLLEINVEANDCSGQRWSALLKCLEGGATDAEILRAMRSRHMSPNSREHWASDPKAVADIYERGLIGKAAYKVAERLAARAEAERELRVAKTASAQGAARHRLKALRGKALCGRTRARIVAGHDEIKLRFRQGYSAFDLKAALPASSPWLRPLGAARIDALPGKLAEGLTEMAWHWGYVEATPRATGGHAGSATTVPRATPKPAPGSSAALRAARGK